MKNITLSADEAMIEQARETARTQKTTLNQLFRNWLSELAGRRERDQQLALLMDRLDYVKSGGPAAGRTGVPPVLADGLPACRINWRTGGTRCLPSQTGSLFSARIDLGAVFSYLGHP